MEDWEQENSQKVGRRSPGDGEGGELLFTGAELASRAMKIVLQMDGGHGRTTLQAQLKPLNSAPQNGHTNRLDVIRARSVMTQGLHQAPLSMGLSQEEHWSGLPCSSPGIFPTQGLDPRRLQLLCQQANSSPLSLLGDSSPLSLLGIPMLHIFHHRLKTERDRRSRDRRCCLGSQPLSSSWSQLP